MNDPTYDAAVRDAYGTADDAVAEMYGVKRRKRTKPEKPVPLAGRSDSHAGYRTTSDARIACACGVFVYTEQVGDSPPAFPAKCWRCRAPLDVTP